MKAKKANGVIFVPKLSASSQDYLEAILELSSHNDRVRSIDVAAYLNVSRASVNRGLMILKSLGYIEQERYAEITITQLGRQRGQEVQERHLALKRFLTDVLGVDDAVAEEDACRMEHSLSPESLSKLQGFLKTIVPL